MYWLQWYKCSDAATKTDPLKLVQLGSNMHRPVM